MQFSLHCMLPIARMGIAAPTAAARLSFSALTQTKGCNHYSQEQHSCIFSWAPLFDSSSIIAVSYREVHWAAVALAQLTLCQPPEWHRLLCASHILIQVSMLVSLLLSRASCCIAGELINQTDLGEYWWNWSFCCSLWPLLLQVFVFIPHVLELLV